MSDLAENVQYLNLEEMKTFCGAHELETYIHVRRPDGSLKKTGDRDRKDVVLSRILDFASTGHRSGPTVYGLDVVGTGPLPASLGADTIVRYGQYEKQNPNFVRTMVDLTDGAFRTGMIARLVLRNFWTAGHAPTMREFADSWLRANAAHTVPRPEGAYLADLARGQAGAGWKEKRTRRAALALVQLEELIAGRD